MAALKVTSGQVLSESYASNDVNRRIIEEKGSPAGWLQGPRRHS